MILVDFRCQPHLRNVVNLILLALPVFPDEKSGPIAYSVKFLYNTNHVSAQI